MTHEHQREQSIERLLRQGAGRAPLSANSTDCLDGELLAAWSSGALPPAEVARVDAHVADCLRCQSMVAAFVRTDAAAPALAPAQKWWSLRWIVPLATAATVAAIWVAAPNRDPSSIAPSQPQLRAESEVRPTEAMPTAPQPPEGPVIDPNTARQPQTAPDRRADSAEKRAPSGRQMPQTADRREVASELAREEQLAVTAPRVTTPAPSPVAEAAPSAARARTLNETAAAASPPPPMARFKTAFVDILSPSGSMRWRFATGSPLERSSDGGATWQPVELPSPGVLTAGHSPGGSVAWVVGRGGAIYITTDGSRFERVPFVEAIDLTSVVAIDDRQATVTTADGRRLTTTTRGSTWTQP